MEDFLANFFWFSIFFILIFIVYFFLLRYKLKKKKYSSIGEVGYLIRKFSLDTRKLDYWKMIIPISLMNAFIISFTATFVMMLPLEMIWQLMIGFVLVFALIYALYEIYGRHLAKKYRSRKKMEK